MLTRAPLLGTMTITGSEREVARARSFVASLLGHGHPSADVACLLVSELVTNAVQHSRSRRPGGSVTVYVAGTCTGIRVDVADDGTTGNVPAVVKDESPLAANGRGLLLVEALAAEWGYQCGAAGTTVWFTLTA